MKIVEERIEHTVGKISGWPMVKFSAAVENEGKVEWFDFLEVKEAFDIEYARKAVLRNAARQ